MVVFWAFGVGSGCTRGVVVYHFSNIVVIPQDRAIKK
jgi:hypothetical protein